MIHYKYDIAVSLEHKEFLQILIITHIHEDMSRFARVGTGIHMTDVGH